MKRPLLFLAVIGAALTGLIAEDREHRSWRPKQDIEVKRPGGTAGRIDFSHERHFAALGNKDCTACHAEKFGLGQEAKRVSLAGPREAEPHAAKSLGRFCANCHRPDNALKAFTAFGKPGDRSCAHCHAPASHGADFTSRHGDRAEHGAAECAECHRGAGKISPAEQKQAQQYQAAQLALAKNPEDKAAFQTTLPNNFCAYCHGAWKGEHERGRHRERSDD